MKWYGIFALNCYFFIFFVNAQNVKVSTDEKLKKFRKFMKDSSITSERIFAYIVSTDNAHQSEYLAPRDKRREFISEFDGSAGTAVITESQALLWTDGRYHQQATNQLDKNWTLMKEGLPDTPSIGDWLSMNCEDGSVVAMDGNLVSEKTWIAYSSSLEFSNCTLRSLTPNLVDLVWGEEQPPMPQNKIIPLSVKYSGQSISEKFKNVVKMMESRNCSILLLTALDEIAYFFNLRGSDIEYNPVSFSYAMITKDELYLFVNPSKISIEIMRHFEENSVNVIIQDYDDVHETLKYKIEQSTGKIWISRESSYRLTSLVPRLKRIQDASPVLLMKAIKNQVEAEGMENCHVRDGVALIEYFAWLENEIENKRLVTELSGAAKLEEFRKEKSLFMGPSFFTISASGPHASIIHYSPTENTNRNITDTEMYMCDSGGQYMDGTTDVTRTWHFGKPTTFEIDSFTRVVKSYITVANTIFPNKTRSKVIDTIARKALWDAGLDYGHGTSHGIGHFLNVHEEPMITDMQLQENMFVSSEPGYYEDGKFGIRIEDIVQIVPIQVGNNFNGRGALTFHTKTLCPIQTKLINVKLLTSFERNYLNSYHRRVYDTIAPIFERRDSLEALSILQWLRKHTEPI